MALIEDALLLSHIALVQLLVKKEIITIKDINDISVTHEFRAETNEGETREALNLAARLYRDIAGD